MAVGSLEDKRNAYRPSVVATASAKQNHVTPSTPRNIGSASRYRANMPTELAMFADFALFHTFCRPKQFAQLKRPGCSFNLLGAAPTQCLGQSIHRDNCFDGYAKVAACGGQGAVG